MGWTRRARQHRALAAITAATVVSAVTVALPGGVHALSGTWTNPVLQTGTTITSNDAPDPYIFFDGTTFHAYTTGTQNKNGNWVNVPNYTSTDLVNWTYQGDALPDTAVPVAPTGWVNPPAHQHLQPDLLGALTPPPAGM
ncbi:MAG: hypothetical protein ACYDAC_10055 [Candidatus Dormibacteria bacterium]